MKTETIKDIKTNGYYVYSHQTPDKMVYFGVSHTQPYKRWQPCKYKSMSIYPYIEKFGWKNIEHMVIQDGLTKEQALYLEDWFIRKATADGFCINKKRSGLSSFDKEQRKLYRKNRRSTQEYQEKQYIYNRSDVRKQIQKKYYESHREQILEKAKAWAKTEIGIESRRKANRKAKQKPATKIYQRIMDYNKTHTPIITPLEAKEMYELTGYIPDFIKKSDLI
jgi:hypothetical protein